jgi:hypothetical protein
LKYLDGQDLRVPTIKALAQAAVAVLKKATGRWIPQEMLGYNGTYPVQQTQTFLRIASLSADKFVQRRFH